MTIIVIIFDSIKGRFKEISLETGHKHIALNIIINAKLKVLNCITQTQTNSRIQVKY